MTVRAKFTCTSKSHDTNDSTVGSVAFQPVYTGSPENEEFFKFTPAGSISMATLNPNAFAQFEPGKDYYVQFMSAEEVSVAQEARCGFAQALIELKNGKRVCREGWNGKGQYIEMQRPDSHSKMTSPYLFIKTVQGDLVPWFASQSDLLAEDWMLAIS